MEIGIHANIVDYKTLKIAEALSSVFEVLSNKLKSDYGGIMEHLWIDFELVESDAKPDGKSRFPFRFAKRVSGRSSFGLAPSPDYYNVGHFSVRPNFPYLLSLPEDVLKGNLGISGISYHKRHSFRLSDNGYFSIIFFRCAIPHSARLLMIVFSVEPCSVSSY